MHATDCVVVEQGPGEPDVVPVEGILGDQDVDLRMRLDQLHVLPPLI